jgi:hypothetical protein
MTIIVIDFLQHNGGANGKKATGIAVSDRKSAAVKEPK